MAIRPRGTRGIGGFLPPPPFLEAFWGNMEPFLERLAAIWAYPEHFLDLLACRCGKVPHQAGPGIASFSLLGLLGVDFS